MAFNSLPDSLIQVGKAITRTLFKTYIKDNLDDLNTRTLALEGSVNKIVIFDEIVINAATLESGGTITGLDVYRVPSDFQLTDAKIFIFQKGSLTGTLEMDIKKSSTPDFTSATSVFTTQPSIDYASASDYDESNNTVFNVGAQSVVEGEFLRFDITELPSGGTLTAFGVYLVGEPS